jgi:hypothetical protein
VNRKYLFGVLMVSLGLISLIVGCGGGGEETISKAEFIEQADAICKKSTKERSDAFTKLLNQYDDGNPPQAELDQLIENDTVPAFKKQREAIAELPSPDEGEEEIEQMLVLLDEAIAKVEAEPDEAINRAAGWFADYEQAAVDFGFKECSEF